ncbi:nucleoside deaminase [Candidatus Woesearchaeota archaeon]|nr:nucleoside deaminase [Candidatus Woesearchaeota archaeon]
MSDDLDKEYMNLAIEQARISLDHGDYPVGSVLVIDDKFISKNRNKLNSNGDWSSHAEAILIRENAKLIRDCVKYNNSKVTLYTTLEPCLMCLGTSVMNRVSRIVYSCPDPHGGATHIDPNYLTNWYVKKWPKIDGGLYREKSFEFLVEFMKNSNWNSILCLFEEMKSKW